MYRWGVWFRFNYILVCRRIVFILIFDQRWRQLATQFEPDSDPNDYPTQR